MGDEARERNRRQQEQTANLISRILDESGPKDYLIGRRCRDNRGRLRRARAASVIKPCDRCGREVYVDRVHAAKWPAAKAVCVACVTGAPDEAAGLQWMKDWLGVGDPRGVG